MKFLSMFFLLSFFVSAQTSLSPAEWLRKAWETREVEMNDMAARLDLEVPPEFRKAFTLIAKDDQEGFALHFENMKKKVGQYKQSDSRTLQGPLWSGPMIEAIGLYTLTREIDSPDLTPDDALYLAKRLRAAIPDGALYFGGTDQGRFLVQASHDVDPIPDAALLTQNALADFQYMRVIRERYGEYLHIPDARVCGKFVERFILEAQLGLTFSMSAPEMLGGKVAVRGVSDVMKVNAYVLKDLMQRNPKRQVFYEESYTIPSLRKMLKPVGCIFEIVRTPVTLTEPQARAVVQFWVQEFEAASRKHPQAGVDFKDTLAKWAGAQAAVLTHHDYWGLAAELFVQALAYAPSSSEAGSRYLTSLLSNQDLEKASALVDTLDKTQPEFEREPWERRIRSKKSTLETIERVKAAIRKNPSKTNLMSLTRLLGAVGQFEHCPRLVDRILAGDDLQEEDLLKLLKDVDRYFLRNPPIRLEMQKKITGQLLELAPESVQAEVENTHLQLMLKDEDAALKSVGRALELNRQEAAKAYQELFNRRDRFGYFRVHGAGKEWLQDSSNILNGRK